MLENIRANVLKSNHLRCSSLAFRSFRKHHHQNVSDKTLIDKDALFVSFLSFPSFSFLDQERKYF